MKRYFLLALTALAGAAATAAATDARNLPAALAAWGSANARAAESAAEGRLLRSQMLANDDVIAGLVDGRLSLADAAARLEANSNRRPGFAGGLGLVYPGDCRRVLFARHAARVARERLGADTSRAAALAGRLEAELEGLAAEALRAPAN